MVIAGGDPFILSLSTDVKQAYFLCKFGLSASLKKQNGRSWRPPKTPSRKGDI